LHEAYVREANTLGGAIAASGRELVYGGGGCGLMGEVARTVRAGGGRVIGIITERLRALEQMDEDNHENIVVETMRERKKLMEARGDAFVILPGGVGTLEEFFEILVGRLLGEHDKPIVVVNSNDPDDERAQGGRYYDPLLGMFDHMIGSKFVDKSVRDIFEICDDASGVIPALDRLSVAAGARAVPVSSGADEGEA
jgi:hypothetical protein